MVIFFYDRISWALSCLIMDGLLYKPKRGMYKINEAGIQLLKTPEKVDKQIAEKEPTRQYKKPTQEELKLDDTSSDLTPQE